ncbi:hypothetical protein D3C84_465450 [compost metagenome]
MRRRGIEQGVARCIQSHPETVPAIERQVVRQARQVVDKQIVGASLGAAQPVTADAIGAGLVHQHKGIVRAQRHAVGEFQLIQQDRGFTGLEVITQQATVAAMLDDRVAIAAIAEAAGSIAEIGVVPRLVDDHVISEAEGHAVGLCGQWNQATLGVQRQQALDPVGDHQQTIGVTRQAQRSAAGIGQHLGGFAVEAGADQTAVMQARNERIVLQQQRFRPVDIRRADTLHTFEALIVGVGAAGEGRCRRRSPGHRLHLGRHQQQKGRDGHDHQQHDMTKLDGSTHALAPAVARCLCVISRKACIDAADSRSMRRLSNSRLAMRIARPLN